MNFVNLFSVPISLTSKPQALALIGEWLREWRILNTEYRIPNGKYRIPNTEYRMENSEFSIPRPRLGSAEGGQNSALFPKIITTPNPEMIVAAQSDPEFLKALQSADLAIPDGIGIVWALRILNTEYRIPNKRNKLTASSHSVFSIHNSVFSLSRLSGIDLMESLIGESAKHGWRVMFLGGRPGVAKKVKRPGLAAQGRAFIKSISGPQNISNISQSENDRLIAKINSFSPDLLFVAFGHPRQEKWLIDNRERLTAGVAIGVGGALDQIADPSLRPPAYINSIGLGWLYRLIRQPWRIKRQLALLKFVWMVIREMKNFK